MLVCLHIDLRARPTLTWNQEPRLLPDSFQCHESNGYLICGKRASVKNSVFQDKPDCLNLHEIAIA